MCSVNIRGHEANFYEAQARCHEAEIEAEARVRPRLRPNGGLEALTSLLHNGPEHARKTAPPPSRGIRVPINNNTPFNTR